MFTKESIIQTITEVLALSPQDYVLVMGGSMVMKNYRATTRDLDIQVKSNIFWKLAAGRNVTKAKATDNLTIQIGDIELFEMDNNTQPPSEIIDGITVQTDDSIIQWKTAIGREKDLNDILNIRQAQSRTVIRA